MPISPESGGEAELLYETVTTSANELGYPRGRRCSLFLQITLLPFREKSGVAAAGLDEAEWE